MSRADSRDQFTPPQWRTATKAASGPADVVDIGPRVGSGVYLLATDHQMDCQPRSLHTTTARFSFTIIASSSTIRAAGVCPTLTERQWMSSESHHAPGGSNGISRDVIGTGWRN